MRATPAKFTTAALFSLALAFATPAHAGVCDRSGFSPQRHAGTGRFMSDGETVYACDPAYGVQAKVGTFTNDEFDGSEWGLGAISGTTAGWARAIDTEDGIVLYDFGRVNLATGKRDSQLPQKVPRVDENVQALAVGPGGKVAWLIDYTNDARDSYVQAVHVWDGGREREVARGWIIRPKYLAFALGARADEIALARAPHGTWPSDE